MSPMLRLRPALPLRKLATFATALAVLGSPGLGGSVSALSTSGLTVQSAAVTLTVTSASAMNSFMVCLSLSFAGRRRHAANLVPGSW